MTIHDTPQSIIHYDLKFCYVCRIEKESSFFYKNRNAKSGLSANCKDCYNKLYANRSPNRKDVAKKFRSTLKGQYKKARDTAAASNREFTITFEQFSSIRQHNCYYCGDVLPTSGSGLDRKNNNVGYILYNVVACCTDCNKTKGDRLSFKEMEAVGKLLKTMRNK